MWTLGFVTRFSGTDATLGLAFAKTGPLYPLFGALIGWLGVALTGSDTSSNVLFGGLRDAYRYTGSTVARDISVKFAGWAERMLAPMSDEQVQAGETVLTSGGDQIFPKGLPIGTVSKVANGKDLFLNIRIKPAADLSKRG